MLPLSLTASTHIRYLLRNVNDSNFDSVYKELCEFIGYGTKESILVLQTCFDQLNIDGKDYKNIQLEPIYVSIFRNMLNRPNFSTLLCESVRSLPINEDHLESICKAVQLAAPERIIIGLALTESENHDVRMCGRSFCMTQIAQLCSNHEELDSVEQIQNILIFLNQSEGLCKHVNSFMEILSLVHSKEDSEFIFAPLVTDEIREINFFRNLEMLNESSDYEFDTILDEMEKELSLADLMSEFGYGCTVNVLQCKEILSLFLPLTEVTVAKIFSTVVCKNFGLGSCQDTYLTFCSAITNSSLSDFPHLDSWNVDVLIESIKQVAPGISWRNVFENFDHEGFHIPNEASFTLLMSIYRHACQEPFPLHAVCSSVWKNAGGQLSFLKHAVSVSPEVFSFAHSGRQLAYIDPVNGHKFHLGHANHAWLCLDLLEVLCLLAERGHAVSVRAMLEYPLKHCPEILLLGMASISTAYNLLQYEVYSAVFPDLLKSTTGASVILHLWHVNPSLLLRGCIDAFSVDQDNITKVLDLCHELKILSLVLEKVPFSFGIRMAALASQKELINLETWLGTNLKTYKDTLFKECLKFIKEVQIRTQPMSPARFNPADSLWNIYCGTISTFLKVLQANAGLISSNNLSEEIEKLSATVMHSSTADNCADDIETDVNSLFHQMFSGELEVDSVILMLTRYKESSEKRDQSLFECMIANLFEEYKFFIKYPERQLKIAAVLFGSLIKHQLVTHLTLGIALRAVLDALRKPADSKMFIFGTKALEQFVDRLIEWPQYCNHILQISHLRGTHSEIIAFIERALARVSSSHSELDLGHVAAVEHHQNSIPAVEGTSVPLTGHRGAQITPQISTVQLQERQQSSSEERHKASLPLSSYPKPALSSAIKPSVPTTDTSSTPKSTANVSAASPSSTGFVRPSRPANSTRFGSALSIETLIAASERRETPIQVPTSEIQDKISFIINNLSPANEEAKAKEFSEFLKEQFYPWFAQYLVMRRASIEPNFHDLYIKFLDKVNSKSLNKEIMQASYENCKVLLGSELIKSSVEERSLLKNLGSWLGKLTIGKNQVLRAREIDPKSLIIEAYEKGFMIGVVPFTSRVLEACKNSIAYRPPNPWTMGILALLTEIYAMPNLKMNLKFDIEVLFKNLAVDMKDVVPSSLLKDRTKETEGNPDFSNKDSASSQTSTVSDARTGRVSPLNQVELSHEVASPSHPTVHSHILSQHTASASVHLSAPTLEDEKVAPFSLSDQPPAQGLLQVQSSFPVSQLPTPASSIEQQVVVNPKLHSLGLQRHFLSVLPLIMEQSIKEIVPGIVQRSVSIATQTTKELVLKDYAMESDETRIRNAAHLMVASLAGSLAHVTCKEPLRASIISHLRISVEGLTLANDLLEQAVQIAANDNLDLGCALIEQAATEKAVHSIDGEIAQQLSIRRKQREGVGPAFFDTNLYTQGHIGVLPEALRPKPGRLSHSQQRVYEDFVRLPWQNQSNQTSSPTLVGPSTSVSGGLSQGYSLASGQPSSGLYPTSGNTGVGNAADSLDLGPEELDAGPPLKQSSGSTMRSGLAESVIQQNLDNDATPASASELQYAEHLNTVKESGVSAHTLPSASPSEQFGSMISEPSLTTGDALDKYQLVSEKLESLLANGGTDAEIQAIVSEVCGIILRCISRDEAALAVAQKVFKGLYENESSNAHIGTHIAILAAIRDVSKLVVKELTSWVIYSDEDRKFNTDITVRLIRSDLLNLSEYNIQMAKLLDAGRNKAATDFAISLIQNLVMNKSNVISELHHLVDALAKLATRPGSPDSLHQLVEIARNPSVTAGFVSDIVRKEDNLKYIRDKKQTTGYSAVSREEYNLLDSVEPDPAGFRDQVAMLFAEWYRICEHPGAKDGASAHFVLKLLQSGLLKGDDMSDRFFRLLMELSVSHCLQSHQQTQPLSFLAIDIYAALVFSILKFCPVDQGSSKLSLLSKVLAVSVRIIFKDAEERKTSFNPRPYFRLFINWLIDLTTLEPVSDGANLQVMLALANAFHALQPLKLPAFSYAWLELMSHRSFMPKLLTGNLQKGWPCFQRLLVDLFQFLEPFLRNAELGEPVHFLYKGTLRVMLVLLHDFPEFLCDYHFSFCDVIPPSCIQMRNIILSAFPRNMRLPDPSTPNLKIDLLAEITEPPRILSEVDAALRAKQIKSDVDEYLKTQQPGTSFLSELKQKLLLSPSDAARAGFRYNVPLINSLVLYIGVQAIQQLQARSPPHAHGSVSLAAFHVGAALDIFQFLIIELDTEGRYLFLNAIANQLRYPNNHTHYFSFILLYLFAESNQEVIQEQITRVLLERLIVNRPHPWGLLITFIELIKNPRYNFWSRSFTRCAPEIEKLFESVSRLCGGPKPVEEGAGSGLLSDMH